MQKKQENSLKRVNVMDIAIMSALVFAACLFVIAISWIVLYAFSSHNEEEKVEAPEKSEIVIEEHGVNFIRVKENETNAEAMVVYRGGGQFELIKIR